MKRQHAILTLIVAAMAVLTAGCQKDKESVTLTAEIQETLSGNGKVFINSDTPCWHNGDEVFINNAAYPVTAASGSLAQIENVVPANSYQAIFPAGIVAESSPNSDNSIKVTLPSMQTYRIADGRQQLDLPMGASLTSGNTLRFYSLCSIVRVTVHNQLNRELLLGGIKLNAKNAKLSGSGIATVSRYAFDSISMSKKAQNYVRLDFTTDCPATVEKQGTGTFDIVVPPFTTDDVTLTLYTSDGYMCEMVMEGMSLARNSIASVTLDVSALTEAPVELISGPAFNAAMKNKHVSKVVFEYNSPVSSGTLLSTPDSPVPIYGNLDGTTWRVSTRASQIHANPDCSNMFESEYGVSMDFHGRYYYYESLKLVEIDYGNRFITDNVTNMRCMFCLSGELTSIDLSNFNTEKVTDMFFMFADCHNLTNLDLSNFNTENVTNMRGMFGGCEKLTRLDISNFSTEKVTDMSYMFQWCTNMTNLNLSHFDMSGVSNKQDMCSALSTESGACTITCPTAVRTALEHGTDLPTSGVVFTWVTP